MPERTPEYQRKAKEYARSLKPYLGHEPTVPDSTSDQETYEYLQRLHQQVLARHQQQPDNQKGYIYLRPVATGGGGVMVTEMYGQGRVIVSSSGEIAGRPELIDRLNAMKPLDQSLPDFLRELAEGGKKK